MTSKYTKTYTSFSGSDIVATITPVGGSTMVIGELQTISYSIHREKFPVRTLGRINPKGFTKGPRTIAGSLIFTVFDRHIIRKLIEKGLVGTSYSSIPELDKKDMMVNMKMDEMPPIDITITFNNEYGQRAVIRLYGITFIDEGQTMSIEDMITEQTMSYMAIDIEVLTEIEEEDYSWLIGG